MIDIPPDIQIRATLREGSVFYYHEDAHVGGKRHYFVVLNPAPQACEDLVLVNATSQVEKARRRCAHAPGTLVVVTPTAYPEFTEALSAFDCNTAYMKSVRQLVSKLEAGELTLHSYMPTVVVGLLRQGVGASPVVDPGTKALLVSP